MNAKKSKALKTAFVYSGYLLTTILLISPLLVVSANPNNFFDFKFIFFGNALIAFIPIFLLTSAFLYALIKIHNGFEKIIFILFTAISIWALYAPVASGRLDGIEHMNISYLYVSLGVLASGFSFVFFRWRKTVMLIILAGPLISAIQGTYNLIQNQAEYSSNPIPVSKTEKNFFVISFDGIESKLVEKALRSDRRIRQELDGFTLFTDTVGAAPHTSLSTEITMLGYTPKIQDYYNDTKIFEKTITKKLQKKGYKAETMNSFSAHEEKPTNILTPTLDTWDYNYFMALKASLLRIWPYEHGLVKQLEYWLIKLFTNNILDAQVALDQHGLAYTKKEAVLFDKYTNDIKLGSDSPTLRLNHYFFTHNPFRLTASCKYIAQSSALEETKCALEKMILLIKKLKSLGVYENSIIFFASDHGHECGQVEDSSFAIGNHHLSKRWCLSRNMPFLMAKDTSKTGSIAFSSTPASLIDITKTICLKALNDEKECEIYTGYNLFSNQPPNKSHPRPVLIQKEDNNDHSYKNFKIVDIGRSGSLTQLMNRPPDLLYFPASKLPTQIKNSATKQGSRIANSNENKILTLGPYLYLPPGSYEFAIKYTFHDKLKNKTNSYWNIFATKNEKSLQLYREEFINNNTPNEMSHVIHTDITLKNLEIRSFFAGSGELEVYSIGVRNIPVEAVCNRTINLNTKNDLAYYRTEDLSLIEPWGRWSDDKLVNTKFKTAPDCNSNAVKFKLIAFVPPQNPQQKAQVFINDQPAGEIQITAGEPQPREFIFKLPASTDNEYTVAFAIENPVSPKSLGISADPRELGLGFVSMELVTEEGTP